MTYNIRDGGRGRVDLLREVITSSGAQIVLLNEADDETIVAELARALEMTYAWGRGSGTKHIALLSRFPIQQWRIYNRRPLTQSVLYVRVEVAAHNVLDVYGVHLLPYFMLLPYEFARWRAVRAMVHLARRHRAPHLILGDFNCIARGEPFDLAPFPARVRRWVRVQGNRVPRLALQPLYRAGYADVFRARHPDDAGFTWMPTRPLARLDYVFADAIMAARARDCRVIASPLTTRASDHFPLIAEFEIAE